MTLEDAAHREIRGSALRQHVELLLSFQPRQGDGPESGADRAAAWIVSRFQLAGLVPAGEGGGYVQFWSGGPADTVGVPNVVGLLPGADPDRAGEYVIILARFANLAATPDTAAAPLPAVTAESAAAAAVLVEVARALAALPARLPRPVLFVAVSGRDGDWQGARELAANPSVDLSGAAAVLAVARPASAAGGAGGADGAALTLAGDGLTSLGPLLRALVAEHPSLELRVELADPAAEPSLLAGDTAPYAGLGIPGVLVWAPGAAPEPDSDRDTWDAGDGRAELAARLARMLYLATHRVASLAERPTWTDAGLRAVGGR
jgi:hypothetical protein